MPWINPVNPTPGSVITAAFAIANWLDPIRWLRLMTGNADPPGTGYVVTSDSVSATSWKTGTGAISSVLGYTPANKNGDTFTGPINMPTFSQVLKLDSIGNGGRLLLEGSAGQPPAALDTVNGLFRLFNGNSGAALLSLNLFSRELQIPGLLTVAALDPATGGRIAAAGTASTAGYVIDSTANSWRLFNPAATANMLQFNLTNGAFIVNGQTIWHQGNDGNGSGLDADTLRTLAPGNASGQIPISNGTLNTNLAAASATNATQVGGRTPTATPTANAIPISDGAGKLDAWVTPASFSIPSGTGIWVRTAAEIPAGFARESQLDGLIPVGAGTSAGQTFVEFTNTGTTWAHTHTDSGHAHGSNAHAHGASALGVGGNTGAASGSGNQANVATPNPASATQSHTHDNGTLDVTGSTDGATLTTNNASAVISSVTWLPPMRAVVWARKT